jgi:hypothetical protein
MRNALRFWLVLATLPRIGALGQFLPPGAVQGERIGGDEAMRRALKASSLTDGGLPFHAVVEIASEKAGPEYSGRVEVWWAGPDKYRTLVTSPKFTQEKVVNGERVFEKDTGDYYPRWLENFVLAVLDPIPVAKNFLGQPGAVMVGGSVTNSCLRRDDRPRGITDQMTWGIVCFSGSEPRIESVLTTNVSFTLKDWKKFDGKQIARTIETDVLDYRTVTGRVKTLEEMKAPDEAMFAVGQETPLSGQIRTEYVSTLTEEGMVEVKPEIAWPAVREGKTEGYMIVYARTDRTGQVRETAKHNSDQPGLEQFGMEQALRFKFKPLVVDGAAVQMEMPLVLHFVSRIENPILDLDDATSRGLISGCQIPSEISDPASAGKTIVIQIQIHPDGGIMTLGSSDRKIPVPVLYENFRACHFAPYLRNGVPTAYHANLTIMAR